MRKDFERKYFEYFSFLFLFSFFFLFYFSILSPVPCVRYFSFLLFYFSLFQFRGTAEEERKKKIVSSPRSQAPKNVGKRAAPCKCTYPSYVSIFFSFVH